MCLARHCGGTLQHSLHHCKSGSAKANPWGASPPTPAPAPQHTALYPLTHHAALLFTRQAHAHSAAKGLLVWSALVLWDEAVVMSRFWRPTSPLQLQNAERLLLKNVTTPYREHKVCSLHTPRTQHCSSCSRPLPCCGGGAGCRHPHTRV